VIVSREQIKAALSPIQYLVCEELVCNVACARLVGGAVRDFFFEYPIDDVDFIVLDEPEEGIRRVLEALQSNVLIRSAVIHTSITPYRTSKIKVHSELGVLVFDLVFPRKEFYSAPGAKPEVSKGTFEEDIKRRDFSMNALCLSTEKDELVLIDLVNGYDDIKNKKLRILHDNSFIDDPVRLVRGLRFKERYGCLWEENTRKSAESRDVYASLLDVSIGRRVQEFYKILFEERPFFILKQLSDTPLLELLLPGFKIACVNEFEFESLRIRHKDVSRQLLLLSYVLATFSDLNLKELLHYFPINKTERAIVMGIRQECI
jgi:tRNA nucleotidyltransferase/poly(A) polymerase